MSDISALLQAASFAAQRHRDQRRKDCRQSPYINHPLAVASELSQAGVTDLDLLIAAVLHDTVEDTDTTIEEVMECFGERIAGFVKEVTDDKSLPKERRKQLQIESAPGKSELAKQLKLADKICNVRDIDAVSPVGWDAARKLAYFDWACQVIAGCRGVNPALDARFDAEIEAARQRVTADSSD